MSIENLQKRDFNFAEGELLLINKPYKWTSFDVVGKVRNSLKPQKLKVGHAGTLDPLATGLLILCTGKLTKQIDTFQAEEKEYTGTMILGATTPSFDLETVIDQEFSIAAIDDGHLIARRTTLFFVMEGLLEKFKVRSHFPPLPSSSRVADSLFPFEFRRT